MSWTFPVDRMAVLVFGRFSEGCLKPALFQPPFVLSILGLTNVGEETRKFPVPFLTCKALTFPGF